MEARIRRTYGQASLIYALSNGREQSYDGEVGIKYKKFTGNNIVQQVEFAMW